VKASMKRLSARAALLCFGSLLWTVPASAWDPATTQAGIAEQAAIASRAHQILAVGLGRPLGLFEPIAVSPNERLTPRMKLLWQRLGLLSSAEGYRPTAESGANPAVAWIAAGAAIEGVPAERGRHHFFDPKSGRGLQDNPGVTGGVHSLKLAVDGRGGLRGLATGTTFDLTGRPAIGWMLSDENELGLPNFLSAMENSVGLETESARQASLAEALMCLGGLGAVLADMGEPAHVRNDFRGTFLGGGTAGSWDQGSDFERFVANKYGRAGIPGVASATERTSLEAYFSSPDGNGLADRTQQQFFSIGTLPTDVLIDAASTPKEVRATANEALTYPSPSVGKLSLRSGGRKYQKANGARQFAYERTGDKIRFFLDEAVYADTAETWLPVIGSYVAGLYNSLLRAELAISVSEVQGVQKVSIALKGLKTGATGTLKLYAQGEDGRRTLVGSPMQFSALASGEPAASFSFELPAGASRVAASVRGQDAAGAFVAVAERSAR